MQIQIICKATTRIRKILQPTFPYTIRESVIKSTNLGISHSSSPASSSRKRSIPGSIDCVRQMTPIVGGKRCPFSSTGYCPEWLQVISSILWEHSHSIRATCHPFCAKYRSLLLVQPLLSMFPGVSSSTFQFSLLSLFPSLDPAEVPRVLLYCTPFSRPKKFVRRSANRRGRGKLNLTPRRTGWLAE